MSSGLPSLARSILDVIGRTPLVELSRSVHSRNLKGRLLVKLEYYSPGGSKKDRIALEIIREAQASGALRPGQTVVELTSGNTGKSLLPWNAFHARMNFLQNPWQRPGNSVDHGIRVMFHWINRCFEPLCRRKTPCLS